MRLWNSVYPRTVTLSIILYARVLLTDTFDRRSFSFTTENRIQHNVAHLKYAVANSRSC